MIVKHMSFDVEQLVVADVASVYSGRDGKCCCGCAGQHFYPRANQSTADQRGGKVNDAMVARVLDIIKRAPADALDHGPLLCGASRISDHNHVSVAIGTRLYVVYLDAKEKS